MSAPRRVLGLSAGARDGSAEIALKEALLGAEATGAVVELVRVDDLDLSIGPNAGPDDAQWFWDRLLDSDALIVSTPIYSRTVPGRLRLLGDKISGPQADVVFTSELLRMRAEGAAIPVDFAIDERVLRPRIAGFIAVGGSIPPRWKTLALPLMHTLTASMQIAVVDQVEFAGAGSPASIVLDPAALERSRRLGTTVGAQAGRSWDDAEYRGEPGVCPLCQLSVVVIRPDGIECASCGAVGELRVEDGRPVFVFPAAGRAQSVLTRAEKLDHFHEVQATAAAHAVHRDEIDALAAAAAEWDPSVAPGPRETVDPRAAVEFRTTGQSRATAPIRDVALEAAGHAFRLRLYPAPEPSGAVLVWLHGGAFMFGSIEMPEADEIARRLGDHGVSVVSVDYTLAPLDAVASVEADLAATELADAPAGTMPSPDDIRAELAAAGPRAHFPVASLQTVAAFDWAAANAASFGGDPARIGLGGASAGGNLAAGAAVRLRDRGGPAPVALLLAYPVLHAELPPVSGELAALLVGLPPMLEFPPEQVRAFNLNYVGDEDALTEPAAFPAGHDQRGLPPTVIVTAERDRLRASAEAFAAELALAGVDVAISTERTARHGFLNEVGNTAALRTVARFAAALG